MTHRRRVRNIVKNGTSSVGGGTPVGGSDGLLIQESSLSLKITNVEPLGVKTETNLSSIAVLNTESISVPTETVSLKVQQAETNAGQTDNDISLRVLQAETNNTPTETSMSLTVSSTESNPTPSEIIKLSLSGSAFNESNTTPSESDSLFIRYWSTASSDNDSSRTTPANANGQNNTTVATVKTNRQALDLTNPVVLTSTTFGTPASGTFLSKKIRAFFSIGYRTTSLDTLVLQYKIGAAAPIAFYTHSGTAAVNNSTSGLLVDVSSLTLTDLTNISLIASYTASVVALPETSITLDAWAIELEQ